MIYNYKFNIDNDLFYINIVDRELIVDKEDFIRILNLSDNKKKQLLINNSMTCKDDITILEFISNNNTPYCNYEYKNGNINDLRKENIVIKNHNINLYELSNDNKYGLINFKNNITIILSITDFLKIVNTNINFSCIENNYPSYKYNNKKITILEYIYNINCINLITTFKDNNRYNLTRDNVNFVHYYDVIIKQKYKEAIYIPGHIKKTGKHAFVMKNPMWRINTKYLIHCDKDIIVTIDEKSFDLIDNFKKEKDIELTIHCGANGYVVTSFDKLYIHQIIMDCYGNGKGTKNISVDHIDQNPLNNCYDNLRIATRKIQEKNTTGIKKGTKRARNKSAKSLPDGITQDMLPKYVVYYKEYLNKETNKYREFFKIEKNPYTDKSISSCKSANKTIFEKLEEIKKKSIDVENGNYIINDTKIYNNIKLPKSIYIKEAKGIYRFVLDKRDNGLRYTCIVKIKNINNLENELNEFIIKINDKYKNSNGFVI